MEHAKKDRLESKGWKIGTVSDFLGLTPECWRGLTFLSHL